MSVQDVVGSAADAIRSELGIASPVGVSDPASGLVTPIPAPVPALKVEPDPVAPKPGTTEPTVPEVVSRGEFDKIMGHKDAAINTLKGEKDALALRVEALEARVAAPPAVQTLPDPAAVPTTAFDALRMDIAALKTTERRRGLEAAFSSENGYKPGIVERNWDAVEKKMVGIPGLSAPEAMRLVASSEDLAPAQPSSTPAPPAPRVEGGPSGTGGVEGSSARQENANELPLSDQLNRQAADEFNKGNIRVGKELMERVIKARAMELLGG